MQLADGVYFYSSPGGLDFSGDICSNTIVIKGRRLVVFDPGTLKYLPSLLEKMVADGLNPADIESIFLTHSHPDHLEAAPAIAANYRARIYMSRVEREFLKDAKDIFFAKYLYPGPNVVFETCEEGVMVVSGLELKLILTPGHTPGGFSIYWPVGKILMTGDIYFPGTIGAINLFGGSPAEMYKSVARLRDLGGVEKVLCGHGPAIVDRDMVIQNYRALFAEIAAKKQAGIV
ncbi:MAG: MBL fold metallo-hydrolase [Deltaproteobacteria bacterium]|jgi:glyoxylase-like metal-dependent hydrolase (beta-lactamase superfamily II)|nr:MBL fold metallo-hydrolase [Deltaproteobacteria bacterium]